MEHKQLNVLFFTGSMSWGGGTERSVSLISSYLSNRDFNVKVLSFFDGQSSFFMIDPEVELCSLNMQGQSPVIHYLNIIYKLRKFLIHNKIDLIVITDVILSLYVFPAILGTDIKTIYRENFNYFTNLNSLKRKFSRLLAIRYSDFIVTITTDDQKIYESKIRDMNAITTIHNVKPFKTSTEANMDSKIVLAVGKLVKQKGFDMLLHAWSKIIKHEPSWKLQIAGAGVEEEKLKTLCTDLKLDDSVKFVGKISNIQNYYENASIYVMSSRFEGFGFVLIEAKELGLPIVSFDCPYGPGEVVRDGIDGLLAEAENIDDLSEKLLYLMHDKELRIEFSKNSLADSRFEKEIILPKWEKVIRDLF